MMVCNLKFYQSKDDPKLNVSHRLKKKKKEKKIYEGVATATYLDRQLICQVHS